MSENEWMSEFANNLVDLMRETNVNQRELADRAGLSEGTVSKYIHKQQLPGVKALINMAYVLDCSLDDLMDFGDRIL